MKWGGSGKEPQREIHRPEFKVLFCLLLAV